MRIAVGSDERTPLTDAVIGYLKDKGYDVTLHGPLAGAPQTWAQVGLEVGRAVASGQADEGVLFCWTGTGVSLAANKAPGVRAALCQDSETARGARRWNYANVLALSLRSTAWPVAKEIMDAWFSSDNDPSEAENIAMIEKADRQRSAQDTVL